MPIINCTVESVPDRSENLGQRRIILSADTASEVRQLLSQSADNTGLSYRAFGNADAVPQLPERCLSRKAELCGVALGIDQPLPLNRDLKYTFPR